MEALEEGATYSESAGAGDGLRDGDTVFLQGRGVSSIGEQSSRLREVGNTSDAGILVVELLAGDFFLGCPNGWEDIWLAFVVTVRTNACSVTSAGISHIGQELNIPRLIFLLLPSALKASVMPRMASGGPWGTFCQFDAARQATAVRNGLATDCLTAALLTARLAIL